MCVTGSLWERERERGEREGGRERGRGRERGWGRERGRGREREREREREKLLSLKWPVNSLRLWNRRVTAGFKTAHYGSLTKSVLLIKILLYTSLVFTLGSSSLVIPSAALLSKSSVRPFKGLETHISWTFIIVILLTVCLYQPSAFSHLNVITQTASVV